jgi:hypothetical protein
MSLSNWPRRFALRFARYAAAAIVLASSLGLAQATLGTGSIVGTVTNPSGDQVEAARVTITNKGTAQTVTTATTSTGTYASGPLVPAPYVVRIESAGFKTAEIRIIVHLNNISTANVKLAAGPASPVVQLPSPSEPGVNLEQPSIQALFTTFQINKLPVDGRNIFALAELAPGLQTLDAGTLYPSKQGFSSVTFDGPFGRETRFEVDGLEISDEKAGAPTQNISLGAVQELSLQQSLPDISGELAAAGSVNITTKSGSNDWHGDGFYGFRDQSLNAALPGNFAHSFQRNQFGGSVGGRVIPDKLFFFASAERVKQDLQNPVLPGAPFTTLAGSFSSPFRETDGVGKIDWAPGRYRVFYRFAYDQNNSLLPFLPDTFQTFGNRNHTRSNAVGIDFSKGGFEHSIRVGYMKFEDDLSNAVASSGVFDPAPGIALAIGGDPNCLTPGLDVFCSGPNILSPQQTVQSNLQFDYNATRVHNNHIFRLGVGLNRIQAGGFTNFLGSGPVVGAPDAPPACAAAGDCLYPGGATNPLNYPVTNLNLGNGQGFFSQRSAFGLSGGGLEPDNRITWHVQDTWKATPTFTITLGLGYVRDTGRTDSDLGPVPFLSNFDFTNQFYTYRGLEDPVHQPNLNLAPQAGFAWDPNGKGKTVIRVGAGLYYADALWNYSQFDRPARLAQGLFPRSVPVCSSGSPQSLPFSSTITAASICGAGVGSVASQIVALQQQYQAATLAGGTSSNAAYIGNAGADGIDITGTSLLAPNYVSPRSLQMNIGVQHEVHAGAVIELNFLRSVSTHSLLAVDTNHVGDFRTLNIGNANAAIAAVIANCGVGNTISSTYSALCVNDPRNGTNDNGTYGTPANPAHPASIADYAANGLDSGYALCGGFACPKAAFPGFNPAVGANQMLFPMGRSVYNGMQVTYRQDVNRPVPLVRHANFQTSFTFSRYISNSPDDSLINFAYDNAEPLRYRGPNGLDRTFQISFAGVMDLRAHFHFTLMSHFLSPLATDLRLPTRGAAGGIFQTDVTGDGTGDGTFGSNGTLGDLLPTTNVGDFGRTFGPRGLNGRITTFNTTQVGQLTPAGQGIVANTSMTQADLTALGGVINGGVPLQPAPAGAINQAWLKAFDAGLSWSYKFRERLELRPGVTVFNVFNLSNFEGPASPFTSILNGDPGSPNGTTASLEHGVNGNFMRTGLGSGVNAMGAPRAMEFQLKVIF